MELRWKADVSSPGDYGLTAKKIRFALCGREFVGENRGEVSSMRNELN